MNEETLAQDIISLLRSRGVDAEEGQGEWQVEVNCSMTGAIFGISLEQIQEDD